MSEIFTTSCWLDVQLCVNFVAAETVPSIFWVNDFLCLDTLLLFSENFAVRSRVSDLLDVKFAAPDYVYSLCDKFCKCLYVSSLEIKNHSTVHFMK